jgi:hypothetical protein
VSVLPDYWIERPPMALDSRTEAAIDEFLSASESVASAGRLNVDAMLEGRGVTTWTFLCGLADRRRFAFHGTGDPGIDTFEPRQPIEYGPFGDQKAVFATTDPVWAMFYAIVDRDRYPITLANGCIALLDADGRPGVAHYFFSISEGPLEEHPWRTGYLYVLPSEGFVEQPSGPFGGGFARVPQLASPVAVTPLARLTVEPDDFPFLAQIGGHDDDRLAEYAQAVMTASPWPD